MSAFSGRMTNLHIFTCQIQSRIGNCLGNGIFLGIDTFLGDDILIFVLGKDFCLPFCHNKQMFPKFPYSVCLIDAIEELVLNFATCLLFQAE